MKEELIKLWTPNTNQVAYNYIWNFDEYGNPGTTYYIQKAHANKKFHWVTPIKWM